MTGGAGNGVRRGGDEGRIEEAGRRAGKGGEKMEKTEGENKEEAWKDGARREEARGRWEMPDGGTQTQHE